MSVDTVRFEPRNEIRTNLRRVEKKAELDAKKAEERLFRKLVTEAKRPILVKMADGIAAHITRTLTERAREGATGSALYRDIVAVRCVGNTFEVAGRTFADPSWGRGKTKIERVAMREIWGEFLDTQHAAVPRDGATPLEKSVARLVNERLPTGLRCKAPEMATLGAWLVEIKRSGTKAPTLEMLKANKYH